MLYLSITGFSRQIRTLVLSWCCSSEVVSYSSPMFEVRQLGDFWELRNAQCHGVRYCVEVAGAHLELALQA